MCVHCLLHLVTRPRQWTGEQTPFYYQFILSLSEPELGEGRLCLLTDLRLLTHRKKGRDYGPAWKAQAARANDLGLLGEGLGNGSHHHFHLRPTGLQAIYKGNKRKQTSESSETQGQYRKRRSHL